MLVYHTVSESSSDILLPDPEDSHPSHKTNCKKQSKRVGKAWYRSPHKAVEKIHLNRGAVIVVKVSDIKEKSFFWHWVNGGKAGSINPSSARVGALEAPFSSLLAFSTLGLDTRLNHAEQGVPTRMLYGTTGVDFSRQGHFHPTHWCFLFPGQHGCGRRVL